MAWSTNMFINSINKTLFKSITADFIGRNRFYTKQPLQLDSFEVSLMFNSKEITNQLAEYNCY